LDTVKEGIKYVGMGLMKKQEKIALGVGGIV